MPRFEKVEEAQAAHDDLEKRLAEMEKDKAKLNAENASRRKAAEELEAEVARLKREGEGDAKKAVRAELEAEWKADREKLEAEKESALAEKESAIRRLTLEGAAARAGFKDPADAVKLLPADVEAGQEAEAVKALAEKYPALLGTPAGGPDTSPGGAGGSPGFKLENGKPTTFEDIDKNMGAVISGSN